MSTSTESQYRDFVKKNLTLTPPEGCPYKLGDTVTFTNDYGVSFSGLKVIGFTDEPLYGRYIHLNKDCYWFPSSPESLKAD